MATESSVSSPYGLEYPTLTDAFHALKRVHGTSIEQLWTRLLTQAGITGISLDRPVTGGLLDAMLAADPVTRLTGHALQIRARSHEHLSAASDAVRSTR